MAKFLLKTSIVGFIALFLLFPSSAAWAVDVYKVVNPTPNVSASIIPQKPPATSLQVEWTAPTMGTGDSVVEYVYAWNHSDTPLTDTELNRTTRDGVVSFAGPFIASKASADFAGEDYNDPYWYFHVKTVYFNTTQGEKLGSDTVVGPFNFDDQAPVGNVALDTETVGQTATTSSVNPVTLKLTATPDTVKVYISNTSTRPQTGVNFATTVPHTVTEGLDQNTIYVWFQDQAGNISSLPKQLTFQLIAGKSMDPAGNLTLEVGAKQTFSILGADTEVYAWSIVDPTTGNPTTVATIDGDSTGVDAVDVVPAAVGSFKVKATPDGGTTVYLSGTITVIKTYTLGDVNDDGVIDSGDAILILRYSVGLTELTSLQKSAGNVTYKVDSNDIDSGDAIKVLRYSVGLITTLD